MPFRFFKNKSPETKNKEIDEEEYQKEKEFFLKYHGIHFFMAREGGEEYGDYRDKNVPEELEFKWMGEYRDSLVKKLENENNIDQLLSLFFQYSKTIGERCYNARPLEYMLDFTKRNEHRFDSFSRILFAEALLFGVNGSKYCKSQDPMVKENVKQYAFQMLNNVIENPIVVSEESRNGAFLERYDFSDENLIQRARDNLSEWENK